jgi:hypothetical protein
MFTLTDDQKSLEQVRDFANTKANGLVERSMSAEKFTQQFQVNAQIAYKWLTDKGSWPPSIEDLKTVHETLCERLQKGGGEVNPDEVSRYNASCSQFVADVKDANGDQRIVALAAHTARCESMQLFSDHNSTVVRLALEAQMDMFLGRANRPAVDQGNYLQAVEEAQNGRTDNLAFMIKRNHEMAIDAKRGLKLEQTQKLGSDYSTDWNDQNPSRQR